MKAFDLMRNPIFKVIGIVVILYIALFSNKHDPESLGNRLSVDQIKQDIEDAKKKSNFIASNLLAAQEASKQKAIENLPSQHNNEILVENLYIGEAGSSILCGNEVEISYMIYSKSGRKVQEVKAEKIIIGSKKNWLIEKNIIGMNKGGIKIINVPVNFFTEDQKLINLLKTVNEDLKYQITVLSFSTLSNQLISCQ
jgi:hypothetical protein